MFPVVFLFLAFSVLVTFLAGLFMFIDVAFSPDIPRIRQPAMNEGRERNAERRQVAANVPWQPTYRPMFVKSKLFTSKRVSERLPRHLSHVSRRRPTESRRRFK
jgi:hypothetical protein